ncbi:MAG: HPr kinase/phosphorylase, partial [Coxiella-like endosymbiont]
MQQKTLHANLLVIDRLGVLITGESNIGKSELTLALLDRG